MNNIIHDILNCKTFDNLNDINMLPSDERLKVLIAYNQMTIYYNDLLFTLNISNFKKYKSMDIRMNIKLYIHTFTF
jgi:hypothetical protein